MQSLTPHASQCKEEVTICFRLNLATDLSVRSERCRRSFRIAGAFGGETFQLTQFVIAFSAKIRSGDVLIIEKYSPELCF